MRIGEIVQPVVYDCKFSEETKSNSSTAVQRLEQLKERIAEQLQCIQQSNTGGGAGQTKKDNLQKQMDNIDKLVQTLTQQGGINTSSPAEDTKPSASQCDEFIKNEGRTAADSAGIYRLGKDSEGNLKILFYQPEEANVSAADSGTDEKPADIAEGEDKAAAAADEEDNLNASPADEDDQDGKEPDSSPADKDGEMVTIVNTDKVDAEIRKIREEKQQVEQEMMRAAGDDDKKAKLEKRLESIESELIMKDNDDYRRQHAQYTTSIKKND